MKVQADIRELFSDVLGSRALGSGHTGHVQWIAWTGRDLRDKAGKAGRHICIVKIPIGKCMYDTRNGKNFAARNHIQRRISRSFSSPARSSDLAF